MARGLRGCRLRGGASGPRCVPGRCGRRALRREERARSWRHGRGTPVRRRLDRTGGGDEDRTPGPCRAAASARAIRPGGSRAGPARTPERGPRLRPRDPARRGDLLHDEEGAWLDARRGRPRTAASRPRRGSRVLSPPPAHRDGQRLPGGVVRSQPGGRAPRSQTGEHHARRLRRGLRARLGRRPGARRRLGAAGRDGPGGRSGGSHAGRRSRGNTRLRGARAGARRKARGRTKRHLRPRGDPVRAARAHAAAPGRQRRGARRVDAGVGCGPSEHPSARARNPPRARLHLR